MPRKADFTIPTWPADTELVGLKLTLQPQRSGQLLSQYGFELHNWFLKQMEASDPELFAHVQESQPEKPFSLSPLDERFVSAGKSLSVSAQRIYTWQIKFFSQSGVAWLADWLPQRPTELVLGDLPFRLEKVTIADPPTTYADLFDQGRKSWDQPVDLTFHSPTSFYRQGHPFPLPVPFNVFHSYMHRWCQFVEEPISADDFLTWVDEQAIVQAAQLTTHEIATGKQRALTGFTGYVRYGLSRTAQAHDEFASLFQALAAFAPYCGTGQKTTLGLGQTSLGQPTQPVLNSDITASSLAKRIQGLTELFIAQRKRTGGERAKRAAKSQATILARQEFGESLKAIAADLNMPYETVKTYAKLARKILREQEES